MSANEVLELEEGSVAVAGEYVEGVDAGVEVDEANAALAAGNLQEKVVAVKLQLAAMGASRKLSDGQTSRAAEEFDAEPAMLRASKRLFSKGRQEPRAVLKILRSAARLWKSTTVPYAEDRGVRLMARERVEGFNESIERHRKQLDAAIDKMAANWEDIKRDAQERLADLYNEADYPTASALPGLFGIEVSYPSVSPPEYLKKISPKIYEQEQARVRAKFELSVAEMEKSFAKEFAKMVESIASGLEMDENGKEKAFRGSQIDKLNDFFEKFRSLNVGSNAELDELVNQAQSLIGGKDAKAIKKELAKDGQAKASFADTMAEIAEKVKGLAVVKAGRSIAVDDLDGDEGDNSEDDSEENDDNS